MIKTTIKTIIFDFDGTIADTFATIVKLFNRRANEFGLDKLAPSEVERLRNIELKKLLKKFGMHLVKLPFIAKKIRDEMKGKMTDIKAFPKIRRTLLKLKKNNFRLGVLSSNSKENIEKFLRANDLMIFDFIYSEKNLFGKGKALNSLFKKLNLNKQETIYIGDEVRDIDACRENGIKIISVTWGFNKKAVLQKNNPNYLIDKPEEIFQIVTV